MSDYEDSSNTGGKKKKIIKIILEIIIVVSIVGSISYGIISQKIEVNKLVLGTNAAKGVSVSEEQGSIISDNFMMYALRCAYLKATEGDKLIDGSYKDNRMRMRKNSSVFNGAYPVFDSETSGKDQAEFFLKVLGNLKDG
ncbi:MAG: hypothetical protein K6F00_08025, partial [Lachnospiraceae bacterium]|nr:hypothetical protein [Lachnospiraceae bacterium]